MPPFPLLFVLISDSLLRALRTLLPDAAVRAFADDTALVASDLSHAAEVLPEPFLDFASASRLNLCLPKTVVIPLGDRVPEAVQASWRTSQHPWATLSFVTCGKYPGFIVGPGHGSRSWDKPLRKFVERVRSWDWARLGLHGAATVYNMLAVPVLMFVAQLETPPQAVLDAELWALRRVAPGPGRWILPRELWRLRSGFGFSFRFRSISWSALAAQARVAWQEAEAQGGLQIDARARAFAQAQLDGEYLGRRVRWWHWYASSSLLTLQQAVGQLSAAGHGPQEAVRDLAGAEPRPWTRATSQRVRSGLQRWLTHKQEETP